MIWPDTGEYSEILSWETIDLDFELEQVDILGAWLEKVADVYNRSIRNIHYIFCSDEYMLQMNRDILNHDFYTDIITFPLEEGDICEAEALISIDRVRENAAHGSQGFETELYRVMIHAPLHLFGLRDETDSQRQEMRAAEDGALDLLKELGLL